MSKNRNRARYNKAQTNKEYKALLLDDLYPLYWDEGVHFMCHGLHPYQWRMYRTWKHSRKTQYKI